MIFRLGLVLLLWTARVHGGTVEVEIRGPSDESIYAQTLDNCHHIERAELRMARLGFADFGENFGHSSAFRISPQLDFTLNSLGYFRALKECFGDSEASWNFFTIDMIFSERVGKATAALLPLGVFKLIRLGILAAPAVARGGPALAAKIDSTLAGLGVTATLAPAAYFYVQAKVIKYRTRSRDERAKTAAQILRAKIDDAYGRDQKALKEAQAQYSSHPTEELSQKIHGLQEDMEILISARSDL